MNIWAAAKRCQVWPAASGHHGGAGNSPQHRDVQLSNQRLRTGRGLDGAESWRDNLNGETIEIWSCETVKILKYVEPRKVVSLNQQTWGFKRFKHLLATRLGQVKRRVAVDQLLRESWLGSWVRFFKLKFVLLEV